MASRSTARTDLTGPVRGVVRLLALAAAILLYVILHFAALSFGRPSKWPRRFLARVARICGADVQVRGAPLQANVLFVANHTSWLDIPIIAGATGTAFVAKSGLKTWPLVGWLADLNNTVYVDPRDRSGVHGQVGAVREALTRHQPIAIFPEGTTSSEMLAFKPSLFEVVAPPPRAVQVQPLRLDYGAALPLAWVGDEPALANIWRVLTHPRFAVRLDCLEPFNPAVCGDRKAVSAEARARIMSGSAWEPARV